MYTRPKRFLSTARLSSWTGGLSRFCLTTNSCTPALSQACTSASAPVREIAIGFSITTCFPASAARTPWSACSPEGVAIVMTSALLSFSIFSYEGGCGTCHCAPACAARSGSVSHTAASSKPSIWSMASKWFLLIRPHPTSAIRNVFSELTLGNSLQLIAFLPKPRAAHLARLGILVWKPLTTLAHPPDSAGRDANHQRVSGNIVRDHASGAYERVLLERDASHDRRIGANRRPPAHERALVLVLSGDVTTGIDDVCENHRRPAEHIVLQHYALVHRYVVLNLDVVSDPDAVHHHHILSERAPLSDHGPAEHVAEVPDLRVRADLCTLVDVGGFVNEGLGHSRRRLPLESGRGHHGARELKARANGARGSRRTRRWPRKGWSWRRRGSQSPPGASYSRRAAIPCRVEC